MDSVSYCKNRTEQRIYIMMDTKTVALARLREIRENAGLTQEMLADYAGISCRTVQRIEAGFSASTETAKALASALELKGISDLVEQTQANDQESTLRKESGGGVLSGLGGSTVFASAFFCCW